MRIVYRFAVAALIAGLANAVAAPASAYQYRVIHDFCTERACTEGKRPIAALTMDSAGTLYGTTAGTGGANNGTVFQLAPVPGSDKWLATKLHDFCPQNIGCKDGSSPNGALIVDVSGNLYGTAESGGNFGFGLVFEIVRQNGGRVLKKIHSFRDFDGGAPTGGLTYASAASGLPYDGVSPLYGTASGGTGDDGVAFELAKSAGHWTLAVIHDFGSGTDGSGTISDLIVGPDGSLYGTTNAGGTGQGIIFKLFKNSHGAWREIVLHSFCAEANCADGGNGFVANDIARAPAGLVMDATGHLFGMTVSGGSVKGGCCGVLFKLIPNGEASKYSVLYDFCARSACADGASPVGQLVMDATGNLYGTTASGGGNNADPLHLGGGTVFKFDGSALQTLHAFCAETNCADGAYPQAGLVMDASGNLFGTTSEGGAFANEHDFFTGTAFELTP